MRPIPNENTTSIGIRKPRAKTSLQLLGLATGVAWLMACGATDHNGGTSPLGISVDPLGQDTANSTIGDNSKNQAQYDQSAVDGKIQAPPTLRPLDGLIGPFGWTGTRIVSRLAGTFDEPAAVEVDADESVVAVGNDREPRVPNRTVATFITRLNPNGTLAWTSTFSSNSEDKAIGLTLDTAGNAFMVGYTYGNLSGIPNAGDRDAFVAKFDLKGNRLWCRLIGTDGHDGATGVITDASGNVYVTGYTNRDFYGSPVAGLADQFIVQFDPNGEGGWSRLLGSSENETAGGITLQGNRLWITGGTEGPLRGERNAGAEDAFVTQYDLEGNRVWTKLFGTPKFDRASHITSDDRQVFVAGSSSGNLRGETNLRGAARNAFLVSLNELGEVAWSRMLPMLAYTPYNGGNPNARPGAVSTAGLAAVAGHVFWLPIEDGFFNWNPIVAYDPNGTLTRTSITTQADGRLNPLSYQPVVAGLAATPLGVYLGVQRDFYDVNVAAQDNASVDRLTLDLIKLQP
jgi:Beta-propeller repeat